MRLLRLLRRHTGCLRGCIGGVIVDGAGELDTKQMARELILAANLAGCAFPGKPLAEGTGSLYNQHIQAGLLQMTWEQTYVRQMQQLAQRVLAFSLPQFERPKLLMLHASDNRRSNTVWLGRQVLDRLPDSFDKTVISLHMRAENTDTGDIDIINVSVNRPALAEIFIVVDIKSEDYKNTLLALERKNKKQNKKMKKRLDWTPLNGKLTQMVN